MKFYPLPNAHKGLKQKQDAVIADLARERAKRRSKNVNGRRGDLPPSILSPWDRLVIVLAWLCLFGFVIFAVASTIKAV